MTSVELQKQYGVSGEFLEILEAPKNGTFRAVMENVCYNCGGYSLTDGYFATGEMLLNGYTPSENELVRNVLTECKDCGEWQAS